MIKYCLHYSFRDDSGSLDDYYDVFKSTSKSTAIKIGRNFCKSNGYRFWAVSVVQP